MSLVPLQRETNASAEALGEDQERSTARTGARQDAPSSPKETVEDQLAFAAVAFRAAVRDGDSGELADWFNPGYLLAVAALIDQAVPAVRAHHALRADAERWRTVAPTLCVVSTGPRGGYYLTGNEFLPEPFPPNAGIFADRMRAADVAPSRNDASRVDPALAVDRSRFSPNDETLTSLMATPSRDDDGGDV